MASFGYWCAPISATFRGSRSILLLATASFLAVAVAPSVDAAGGFRVPPRAPPIFHKPVYPSDPLPPKDPSILGLHRGPGTDKGLFVEHPLPVVEEQTEARGTLGDLGYKPTKESVLRFQQDYQVSPSGRLDEPTIRALGMLQDLQNQSSAGQGEYLVIAIGPGDKPTEGNLYRVTIPGQGTRFVKNADEFGEYVISVAREKNVKTSYVLPHLREQDYSALKVSMNRQSRSSNIYVLANKSGSVNSNALRVSFLEPRGPTTSAKVLTKATYIRSGEWKGQYQAKFQVESHRGPIVVRVVAKTKAAILHFFERLQYHLANLEAKLSVAYAIHKAKADTMKVYNLTEAQLSVQLDDQAGNTRVAEGLVTPQIVADIR